MNYPFCTSSPKACTCVDWRDEKYYWSFRWAQTQMLECVLMRAINVLLPNFLNNGIDIINFEWLTQWFLNSKSDQILLASRHIVAKFYSDLVYKSKTKKCVRCFYLFRKVIQYKCIGYN